jgi:hypothetical protein
MPTKETKLIAVIPVSFRQTSQQLHCMVRQLSAHRTILPGKQSVLLNRMIAMALSLLLMK